MIAEHNPNDPKIVDQMLSEIYESETFNHHAHAYAIDVLRYYFGEFDLDWYCNYIQAEDFRSDDTLVPEQMKYYERMYDMYWDARGEWWNQMAVQLVSQNTRESNRVMYLHTLTTRSTWEEYSKAVQEAPHINHTMEDE